MTEAEALARATISLQRLARRYARVEALAAVIHAIDALPNQVRAVPDLRARVVLDPEGWPTVPARYGRLEWRGVEATGPLKGSARVYAYADWNRILSRITAVPGTRRCQVGEDEGVVSMAREDHAAIRAVARLLRCHTDGRGRASKGRSAEDLAALRPAAIAARSSKPEGDA